MLANERVAVERDLLAKLEKLIDRLLAEREELLKGKKSLTAERDDLLGERSRVQGELEALLGKLERLEGEST